MKRIITRYGFTNGPQPGKTNADRFWVKVEKGASCWEWKSALRDNGYGAFSLNGKAVKAHRYSWVLHFGPIPKGVQILHHCDNPKCVRPDHLFAGNPLKNMRDMLAKSRHGNTKISRANWAKIARVYDRHKDVLTHQRIGEWFGVSTGTVANRLSPKKKHTLCPIPL